MQKKQLTPKEAFGAMQHFLDQYYFSTSSDNIGGLLGSMQFLGDGLPIDPAIWQDWLEATNNKEYLTIDEAFDAMVKFLKSYSESLSFPEDIEKLIDSLKFGNEKYQEMRSKWENSKAEIVKLEFVK